MNRNPTEYILAQGKKRHIIVLKGHVFIPQVHLVSNPQYESHFILEAKRLTNKRILYKLNS